MWFFLRSVIFETDEDDKYEKTYGSMRRVLTFHNIHIFLYVNMKPSFISNNVKRSLLNEHLAEVVSALLFVCLFVSDRSINNITTQNTENDVFKINLYC